MFERKSGVSFLHLGDTRTLYSSRDIFDQLKWITVYFGATENFTVSNFNISFVLHALLGLSINQCFGD